MVQTNADDLISAKLETNHFTRTNGPNIMCSVDTRLSKDVGIHVRDVKYTDFREESATIKWEV